MILRVRVFESEGPKEYVYFGLNDFFGPYTVVILLLRTLIFSSY